MKKWLLPLGSLTAIAIGVVVALAVAGVFDRDGTSGDGAVAEADDAGEGTDVAGVCVEGVPDCVDMIVDGDGETGDGPAGACLVGETECNDMPDSAGDVDPDEPVVSDPGTSDGSVNRTECTDTSDACLERAVQLAIADLQERLAIDAESIEIGDSAFQEWSNACLNAAGPGEVCAEVITPGFVVVLAAEGNDYEYHTDLNGNVRLAE